MHIPEIVKKFGRSTNKLLHLTILAIGCIIVAICLMLTFNSPPPEDPNVIAIHHELIVQATELDHRIKICQEQIDNMSLKYSQVAAYHCEMMWEQMKKLESFISEMKLQESDEVVALVERSVRAALRYSEYQKEIDDLTYTAPRNLY